MYGVKTFSLYNDIDIEQIGASEVVGHERLDVPIEMLSRDSNIYFVKTHELPKDDRPAIYIVRDGRDAVVSFAHWKLYFQIKQSLLGRIKRFVLREDVFKLILKNIILSDKHYGGWSQNVIAWTKKRSSNVTFSMRYEDLIQNPIQWVKSSLESLNINLQPASGKFPSFDELHEKWPEFFRKGKIGAWREEMPSDLQSLFWKHHSQAMKIFDYSK